MQNERRRSRVEYLPTSRESTEHLEDAKNGLGILQQELQELKTAVVTEGSVLVEDGEGKPPKDNKAFRATFDMRQLDLDQDNHISSEEVQVLEGRITSWSNWTATFVPE